MKPQSPPASTTLPAPLIKLCTTISTLEDKAVIKPTVLAELQSLKGAVGQTTVRIAFGGHCNAGKSSTLNALLGRPIMPVGNKPLTGVPLLLQSAPQDEALLVNKNGSTKSIVCTQEGLTEACQLLSQGERRGEIESISHIHVQLNSLSIPANCAWIDTPGIDDTPAMTERAWLAAREADLLVWVLTSRHPLSENEAALLTRYISERGPASVVLVLNCFLDNSTDAAWTEFDNEVVPHAQHKVDNWLRQINNPSIQVIPLSAISVDTPRGRTMIDAMRTRLTAIDGPEEGLVVATRQHRAKQTAQSLADSLTQPIATLKVAYDVAKAAYDKECEAYAKNQKQIKQFKEAYKDCVRQRLSEAVNAIQTIAREHASSITSSNLRRDKTYTKYLKELLSSVETLLKSSLLDDVDEILAEQFGKAIVAYTRQSISSHSFRVKATPDIKVPKTESGAKWIGMIIGGLIGFFGGFGIGFIPGAFFGYLIGSFFDDSKAQDLSSVQRQIIDWSSQASEEVEGLQTTLDKLFKAPDLLKLTLSEPDMTALSQLSSLQTQLRTFAKTIS